MRIHLITCVKEKQNHSCPAVEMYQGTLFQRLVTIAQKEADRFFILSGKYGLLLPEEIIDPYDVHLGQTSDVYQKKWSAKVIEKLQLHTDLLNDHFVLYCSEAYHRLIIPAIASHEIPMVIE